MDPMAGSGAGAARSPGFPAIHVLLSRAPRKGAGLVCAVALLAIPLASCAPVEQRRAEGTSWVVQQEQERLRLESSGFPQFSGSN